MNVKTKAACELSADYHFSSFMEKFFHFIQAFRAPNLCALFDLMLQYGRSFISLPFS